MKFTNLKLCAGILITCLVFDCALSAYIGVWREAFWSSVQQKNLYEFIWLLVKFTGAALVLCVTNGLAGYYMNYTALAYRRILTRRCWKHGLKDIEGRAQRIQEDCMTYPQLTIGLTYGLVNNLVTLIAFMVIIGVALPAKYLFIPILYAIIGTYLAHKIAKPLINLNYFNQVKEAAFRALLTRKAYVEAHMNNYKLFMATKRLTYFQSFYAQITVIVPYILLAGAYFGLQITFGVFMQCSSAMQTIIDSLSYFVKSFDNINRWLSCRKRLSELHLI